MRQSRGHLRPDMVGLMVKGLAAKDLVVRDLVVSRISEIARSVVNPKANKNVKPTPYKRGFFLMAAHLLANSDGSLFWVFGLGNWPANDKVACAAT